jgi:hypothetical protein
MEMYRDQQGHPVGVAGSVLTRSDGEQVGREQFRDAITAFSTVAWLGLDRSADPWLFEVWRVPSNLTPHDRFARRGKFFINHTAFAYEKVGPNPYTFPITLRADLPDMLIDFIKSELLKGTDNPVLRALSQLHEVRFETPYFTSQGNDVEALWTGFEALMPPDASPVSSSPSWLRFRILRKLWGALFTRRAQHTNRADLVAITIHKELAQVPGIHSEATAGIGIFLDKLWKARNVHSHAGHGEPAIQLEVLGSNVLAVGIRLFELLLRIRIAVKAGDDIFFLPQAVSELNELFKRESTIKSTIDYLSKLIPRDWYPPNAERGDELRRLREFFQDFVNFERVDGWTERRDVAKARGAVRRILNSWIKELAKTSPHIDEVSRLADFPKLDTTTLQALKAKGMSGAALEDALDRELVSFAQGSDVWRTPVVAPISEAPPLGGIVPLWLWVRAYIRLEELFRGFKLV